MPPPAVDLDVPERRCDPVVLGSTLGRAVGRLEPRRSSVPRSSSSIQRESRKSRATISSWCIASSQLELGALRLAARAEPAAMKSRKSGWALVGFDLNSGWNWTARNQG